MTSGVQSGYGGRGAQTQNPFAQVPHGVEYGTAPGRVALYSPVFGASNLTPRTRSFASWYFTTTIGGTTSVSSVLTGGRKVYVYDHDTGRLLASVWSDASGSFTVKGLPIATAKYHFSLRQIATDTGSYNEARADRVTQS
jgi:hypothetical protein